MSQNEFLDTLARHDPEKFERQIAQGGSLPINIMKCPVIEGDLLHEKGILYVGDGMVNDILKKWPNIKKRYFLIAATQSDVVPTTVGPDFYVFSNSAKVDEYLKSPAAEIPYICDMGCGQFVNPAIFYPDTSVAKEYDVLYVAKWIETKRIELLFEAALELRDLRIGLIGIPMLSGRKRQMSEQYRQFLKEFHVAHNLNNLEIIEINQTNHRNLDGTDVPGGFTKDEMKLFYQKSRLGVLLSLGGEGVNRSAAEALCCDVPVLMTRDMKGDTLGLVRNNTGILVSPNGSDVACGIRELLLLTGLTPRVGYLERFGIVKTNDRLKAGLLEALNMRGEHIDLNKMKPYSGDMWSMDYKKLLAELGE